MMSGTATAGRRSVCRGPRHLAAAAVFLALFSSSGCLTAAMWGWAAEPMPTSRAAYRSSTPGGRMEPAYESRVASYRSDGGEARPVRVAAAAVLTPATLVLDVLFMCAAADSGGDYNPFWGFKCAAERKRNRGPNHVKASYRPSGPAKPSASSRPPKPGRGRKPSHSRSSYGGGSYSGARYGKL